MIFSVSIALGDISGDISAEGIIKTIATRQGDFTGVARADKEITALQAVDLDGAILSAGETIRKVALRGDIFDSYLLAGYDIGCDCAFGLQQAGGGDELSNGSIKSVTVKGVFESSYLSAGCLPDTIQTSVLPSVSTHADYGSIGSVKFGTIAYNSGNEHFGLYASTEIKPSRIGREIMASRDLFDVEVVK